MALATPSVFAHVQLDAGATVTLGVDELAELGLYVLEGAVEIGTAQPVIPGELAVLTSGARVVLTAASDRSTTAALIGGQPVQGPILFSGPFVMDTPELLLQAKQDYLAGKMGRLEGVPF